MRTSRNSTGSSFAARCEGDDVVWVVGVWHDAQIPEELAKAEDVSINQLTTTALAEKMSALMTVDYLQERAARGDRGAFERAMAQVRDSASYCAVRYNTVRDTFLRRWRCGRPLQRSG